MKSIYIAIVNATFFIISGIVLVLFSLLGKPYMQGFYCDDTSIDKPYKHETVSISALFILTLLLGVACFIFGKYRRLIQGTNELWLRTCETNYKQLINDVAMLMIIFIYGSIITTFITDVGKYSIGRLRPHYLTVCQPDWLNINCTNTIGRKSIIFGDTICQTNDFKVLKESHLSFPSGHASYSGFSATFLIVFLESQIEYNRWEMLPKYFLQALIGAAAFYVGLSRVTDNFHHPTDVLIGFIIGIFIGIAMHYSLVNFYYPKSQTNSSNDLECNDIVELQETH